MARLNLPSPTVPPRRYRAPIGVWIFVLFILMISLAAAVASIIFGAELLIVIGTWAFALLTISMVWVMFVSYIDIEPDVILIHTPGRTRIIAWGDLDEIRWVSEHHAEVPYFCTSDGRQVRAPFGRSPLGIGDRHFRRMLDDAEQMWQRHLREQTASMGRPTRVFRRKV